MTNQGFSFIEVLISVLLATTISLALLEQQWQLTQWFNQVLTRRLASVQIINEQEKT